MGQRQPDYLVRNRRAWDRWAKGFEGPGRQAWATDTIEWGVWGVPETELRALPDVAGMDVAELGCGTGYFSAWMARRGARPVGIDNSPVQLANARRFMAEFGPAFPLVHASAEAVPLRDAAFDLVFSEYGAAIWSDPHLWIPEAARLLRPGGRLIFLVTGTLLILCAPQDPNAPSEDRLLRDYFGLHRIDWPDEDQSVEFHLGYGDWIRLLRAQGFEVEDLIEVRAPEGATTRFEYVTPQWARRWPSEQIWKARKR